MEFQHPPQENESTRMIRENAREFTQTAIDLVRKYPLQSIAGALSVGLLLGTYLGRKSQPKETKPRSDRHA